MYELLLTGLLYIFGINLSIHLFKVLKTKSFRHAFTIVGGGGGKGDASPPLYTPPAIAPAPPTVDDAAIQEAVLNDQKRRSAAAGLASTDISNGTLAANASNLNKKKPTLLGGEVATTTPAPASTLTTSI